MLQLLSTLKEKIKITIWPDIITSFVKHNFNINNLEFDYNTFKKLKICKYIKTIRNFKYFKILKSKSIKITNIKKLSNSPTKIKQCFFGILQLNFCFSNVTSL